MGRSGPARSILPLVGEVEGGAVALMLARCLRRMEERFSYADLSKGAANDISASADPEISTLTPTAF